MVLVIQPLAFVIAINALAEITVKLKINAVLNHQKVLHVMVKAVVIHQQVSVLALTTVSQVLIAKLKTFVVTLNVDRMVYVIQMMAYVSVLHVIQVQCATF